MKVVLGHKKINVEDCNTIRKRFISFKFRMEPISEGLYFAHKKIANTYLFCQRVDLCFTNSEQKILYLYSNVKSEQMIIHLKAKNLWIFPLGTSEKLKVGDILKIEKKEIF